MAEINGEPFSPMKFGGTQNCPHRRAQRSYMAPEKPIVISWRLSTYYLGVERDIQNHLKSKGRHIADAIGNEWFNTSPEELERLIKDTGYAI